MLPAQTLAQSAFLIIVTLTLVGRSSGLQSTSNNCAKRIPSSLAGNILLPMNPLKRAQHK